MDTSAQPEDIVDIDFQGIALPAVLLGTDLTVRRFSPQAEKILNLVSSDLNKAITEIKLSIQAPDLDKVVRGVINTGHIFEREIQDKSGRWYSMRIRPYKRKYVITGTVIVLVDIHDIKTKSDDFKEERDYSSAIIDTLREPFLILKKDFSVESANRSFYHTFESSPEEILGRSIDHCCNSPDLKDALEEILTRHISVRNLEIEHMFPRLGSRTLLINARKVRPDNQTEFIFLGIEDVTEKKEIEQERRKALAALEQFAASASHDLREPLRTMIMLGESLEDHVREEGSESFGKMLEAANRMSDLMEELLDFSRVNTQVELLEPVDLVKTIADVVADLGQAIKESGTEIVITDLPHVKANPTQMCQLFQNLIANAIKYRKENVPPRIDISCRKISGGYFGITIKDNGIGFEQKQAREIFKPFKRLHGQSEYAGSGLGLALCEKIVSRYGGEIHAESSPGQGATFLIKFPSFR